MRRLLNPNMLLVPLLALVVLASCKESDDEVEEYPDWQAKNEQFFANKYNMVRQQVASGSSQWKIFNTFSKNDEAATSAADHILVKVLEEGTGSGCPLYTDTVRVHYRGQLLASTSYVDSSDPELGYVFDKSWTTDTYNPAISIPHMGAVSLFVDGFTTALQHMHIGDHWLVYMPYQLAYGTSGKGSVPGYSTLVFDMMLAAYYHPGAKVPDWQAGRSYIWDPE